MRSRIASANSPESGFVSVAPILSTAAFGVVLYLAVTNFTTMTGASITVAVILQLIVWSVFLAGVVLALIHRSRHPEHIRADRSATTQLTAPS